MRLRSSIGYKCVHTAAISTAGRGRQGQRGGAACSGHHGRCGALVAVYLIVCAAEEGGLYEVLHDYQAENEDELELVEGQLVTLLNSHYVDQGWWKGRLGNKVGVFPNNFVRKVEKSPPEKPIRKLESAIPQLVEMEKSEKIDKLTCDKEMTACIFVSPVETRNCPKNNGNYEIQEEAKVEIEQVRPKLSFLDELKKKQGKRKPMENIMGIEEEKDSKKNEIKTNNIFLEEKSKVPTSTFEVRKPSNEKMKEESTEPKLMKDSKIKLQKNENSGNLFCNRTTWQCLSTPVQSNTCSNEAISDNHSLSALDDIEFKILPSTTNGRAKPPQRRRPSSNFLKDKVSHPSPRH